jgi:hypothetical protein
VKIVEGKSFAVFLPPSPPRLTHITLSLDDSFFGACHQKYENATVFTLSHIHEHTPQAKWRHSVKLKWKNMKSNFLKSAVYQQAGLTIYVSLN